jgi:predicted protein tyrosine phosphatase
MVLVIYNGINKDDRKRTLVSETIKREEEIVLQMEKIHHQQKLEQKLRQSIRENSVELRELENKLNYAYMNKERSLQLEEKKLLLQHKKVWFPNDCILVSKFIGMG